ncbi:E3 SUMO-protein ligase KIAA1586-like [Carassius auratus]|uniref:E3 SUMO-protein ligase KIAA1586-like n=1 Tax=Carassius auratus TaxID=7957 RepID=A0A6P6NI83_CARAU|nr:E3 SUMO-protein ligase KIAA1586-like [Carassius auratus]
MFLDLIELEEGTTADAIYKALKKSLLEADLDDADLKSHLICITTDGASVMTGRQSGLITRLKKDYPLLESIHCLAHRLELSNRSTSLMEATREIKMTIEVLKAFKITPGKSMEKAAEAVKVGEFKQVPLRSSKENVNRFLFLQAIIDSLSSRMPLHDTNLTKIITPLDPLNWPKSRESLILFGEKEIHDLAKDA